MAAVVTKMWSPPVLGLNSDRFTAADVYQVSGVADANEAVGAVVAAYPETAHNAQHPLNAYLLVSGKNTAMDGFNFYRVTVNYASTPSGRHPNPGAPLSEPVRWRWEPLQMTVPSDRDYAGNVIRNAAGEPFSSPVPAEVQAVRLYAIRNEAYFQAATALSFQNSVNTLPVAYNGGQWAVTPGQSMVRFIMPLTEITSIAPYVQVQYVIDLMKGFTVDSDGFDDAFKLRILNAGRRGWYDATHTGPIVELLDGRIQNVSQDVRLDASGKPIRPEYKIGTGTSFADPVDNPNGMPASQIIEVTTDATFIKCYPDRVTLKDHNLLNLP